MEQIIKELKDLNKTVGQIDTKVEVQNQRMEDFLLQYNRDQAQNKIEHADLADTSILVQKIDMRSKTVVEKKKFLVITGHYLKYDNSYAQDKGMPIGKEGSPKIQLFSNKHNIHIST